MILPLRSSLLVIGVAWLVVGWMAAAVVTAIRAVRVKGVRVMGVMGVMVHAGGLALW